MNTGATCIVLKLSNHTENQPPYTPSNPDPSDGMIDVEVNTTLSWIDSDPNAQDMLTYDVYFGINTTPPKIVSNQTELMNDPRARDRRTQFRNPSGTDGTVQLVYESSSPLHLRVAIRGYDVSGLPIRSFLRTPDNYTNVEADRAGDARFPPGSVAYLSTVHFQDDVLMLPRKESFTGAANTRQMITNFSRDIAYCLSYEDRNGARPYAMMFRDANAARGRVQLYAAKAGTMFCARASEEALAEGTWEETTVARAARRHGRRFRPAWRR